MGTGGKIAIGCGMAVLVVGMVLVLTVGAGLFWAKGKVESVAAEQKQITELQEKANQNTFVEPEDGAINEPQLVKFIEVRRRVYDVYVKHEAAIKGMKDRKEAGLEDVRKAFTVMNDIRLAQARAQAELGMNDSEYAFLVRQVYASSWAAQNEQADQERDAASALDVPPANIELFRKYEADLKKYAMSGLELIGL